MSVLLTGIVVNCETLKIRMSPNRYSETISEIAAGRELLVDNSQSNEEWFCVYLEFGVKGYCMRKYIEIKE